METVGGTSVPGFGHIDSIKLESCGVLRISGWSTDERRDLDARFEVLADDRRRPPFQAFDCYRPDVARAFGSTNEFLGFGIEYLIEEPGLSRLRISFSGDHGSRVLLDQRGFSFRITTPAYAPLRHSDRVRGRDDIYTFGPPGEDVAAEILALTSDLSGSVLDLGCGKGNLVRHLRARGIEAWGLELDRPEIASAVDPALRAYVTLYDGRFPIPFPDASFDNVVCVETLEHIRDAASAVSEMARVGRSTLVVTVPDMTAIPLLFKHAVVPWHLLESTHLNFFTQMSLAALLRPHWPHLRFARACPNSVNGTTYWTSLVALCSKE